MSRCLSLLVLGVVACVARADGPPPSLVKIADVSSKDKTISSEIVVSKCMPYTVQKEVVVNGRKEAITATEMRIVCERAISPPRSLKEAKAYDGGGAKLTDAQMWQRLRAGDVIILATDNLPNADYMKVLRKEALVLVLPSSAMMIPPPAAAPTPAVAAPPGAIPAIPILPAIPAPPRVPGGSPAPPTPPPSPEHVP